MPQLPLLQPHVVITQKNIHEDSPTTLPKGTGPEKITSGRRNWGNGLGMTTPAAGFWLQRVYGTLPAINSHFFLVKQVDISSHFIIISIIIVISNTKGRAAQHCGAFELWWGWPGSFAGLPKFIPKPSTCTGPKITSLTENKIFRQL